LCRHRCLLDDSDDVEECCGKSHEIWDVSRGLPFEFHRAKGDLIGRRR